MRKIGVKTFGPDENGNVYEYFDGYCNSDETKPTEFVADGSNVIETDTGNWWFFNEDSKSWSVMLNIQG